MIPDQNNACGIYSQREEAEEIEKIKNKTKYTKL